MFVCTSGFYNRRDCTMSRVVVNEIEAKVGNDITFNDTVKIDTIKGKTTAG